MRVRIGIAALSLAAGMLAGTVPAGAAAVINVPADQPTIQAAVDAAADGDTVLVAAGSYFENVVIADKSITLAAGSGLVVIDGGGLDSVVTITNSNSVLRGFLIQNGRDLWGGGVSVTGGAPLVELNTIAANTACDSGAGVSVRFSAATVRDNTITENRQQSCSGGSGGGGVLVGGAGTAQILDNHIVGNSHGTRGGGIALNAAGSPVISGNVIESNDSGTGGGIAAINVSDALIVNNFIVSNSAGSGGGIYWLVPSSGRGPFVHNNTIAANTATAGAGIFADGFDANAEIINNVITAVGDATVVHCGTFNDPNPPIVSHNDVFSNGGTRYGGLCSDVTGTGGNISADPMFVGGGDFHLQAGSPAIDAADDAKAPAVDIDGDARPADGDGDGAAVADMGADEAPVAGPLQVDIDIKPKDANNRVRLRSKSVDVAVLTTATFDATSVDPTTVRFGPAAAGPTKDRVQDVDGDGDLDYRFWFRTADTGITRGDTEACLTGATTGGRAIAGCDAVNVR